MTTRRRPARRRPWYRRHPGTAIAAVLGALTASLGFIVGAMWLVVQPELWACVAVLELGRQGFVAPRP